MPVRPKRVASVLVGHQEEDVGASNPFVIHIRPPIKTRTSASRRRGGYVLGKALRLVRLSPASPALYLNHCTGARAFFALKQAFGERVSSCTAGTIVES